MRQFVFNALLAENSLAQLAGEGIAIRGTATPPVIAVDDFGFSPRIVYDAKKCRRSLPLFFALKIQLGI